jgi:lipoprotein NlpD
MCWMFHFREVGLKLYQLTFCVLMVGVLAACSAPRQRAPVEDKTPSTRAVGAPAAASAAKPMPGAENAGKAGYYTVKPGDTLARIGLEVGQNWRDVARWNGIDNPNLIEVGQVLRVVRPGVETVAQAPSVAAVPGAAASGVATNPVGSPTRTDARPLESKPDPVPASAAGAATPTPAPAQASAPSPAGDEDVAWGWPSGGAVVASFDEARTKGLVIAGQAGDAVVAAANGRVVYVGAELRGYGNLVIIKHNNTYLTAYAHNQSISVKEDQIVRRGQKIAEMGSSDASRVQLHFEVRRLGKPIDPMKVLPAK